MGRSSRPPCTVHPRAGSGATPLHLSLNLSPSLSHSLTLTPAGAEFEADERGGGSRTGEEVLQRFGFGDASLRSTLAAQGRIMLAYYWLSYCILKRKQPRYQPLEAPPA